MCINLLDQNPNKNYKNETTTAYWNDRVCHYTLRANERKEIFGKHFIGHSTEFKRAPIIYLSWIMPQIISYVNHLNVWLGNIQNMGWTFIDGRNLINYGKSQSTFNRMSSGQMWSLFWLFALICACSPYMEFVENVICPSSKASTKHLPHMPNLTNPFRKLRFTRVFCRNFKKMFEFSVPLRFSFSFDWFKMKWSNY